MRKSKMRMSPAERTVLVRRIRRERSQTPVSIPRPAARVEGLYTLPNIVDWLAVDTQQTVIICVAGT